MFDEQDECFILVPQFPLKKQVYICDKIFHVEVFDAVLQESHGVSMVRVSGSSAKALAIRSDGFCSTIWARSTHIHRAHNKGGQSAPRFQRLHQEAVHAWHVVVSEAITSHLSDFSKIVLVGSGDKTTCILEILPLNIRTRCSTLTVDDATPDDQVARRILSTQEDTRLREEDSMCKEVLVLMNSGSELFYIGPLDHAVCLASGGLCRSVMVPSASAHLCDGLNLHGTSLIFISGCTDASVRLLSKIPDKGCISLLYHPIDDDCIQTLVE